MIAASFNSLNALLDVSPAIFAFFLTLLAGLATGIGSALAFFAKRTNAAFLATSLGFSAGVMIYVSFVEIIPNAREAIMAEHSDTSATWIVTAAFFAGVAVIALLDRFVPEAANPHEYHELQDFESSIIHPSSVRPDVEKSGGKAKNLSRDPHLMRVGVVTALALAIHNFPEGFATFLSGLQAPELAIPVAVAIAIHNIPEGIAVSVPIYYATGSRKKGFWLSFASGFSEPLGALIGWAVLSQFLNDTIFGIVFAAVAGVMVFISLDELLPTAEKYGEHHHAIYGLIAGMAVMALSLLLFL